MEKIRLEVVVLKKTQTIFVVLALSSVFLLSFLIGRATALRDNAEGTKKDETYTGTIPLPESFINSVDKKEPADVSASTSAKVKEEKDANSAKQKQKKEPSLEDNPPTRMLFPCGNSVLKPYSESAIYSETMKDWRAHKGIDFAAEKGTPVHASWEGTVTKVEKSKIWGYTVEITHSGGVCTVYKNLNRKIEVKEGQAVKKNQVIGTVGKSASVESHEPPHLHFEIKQDGTVINPESYVY